MSDDDCDIFSMPTKRAKDLPQKFIVPDQELKPADYDFIEINPEIKRPTKVSRGVKQAVQEKKPKTRTGKLKRTLNDEESKNNVQEEEVPVLPNRDLSPVSQMIFEMEKNKVKNALDEMPVARRTRSSLGARNPAPEKAPEVAATPQPQPLPSPPKKRKTRARKNAKKATTETTNSEVQNVMPEATNSNASVGINAENSILLNSTATATRGNRREVAEIAARSRVLDSIDLVSAVMPRIEGFVNLDSEEESTPAGLDKPDAQTNAVDDDNPEISINLSWLGEIQMYKLRQHQKFSHMFKEISKRNKVPIDDIVINFNDRFIKPTESPQVVGLKIYHILNGCAMKSSKNSVQHEQDVNPLLKPKKFQLKVQGDKWKKPLIIIMKKTEAFKILAIKCAEEMECDVQDFRLFFDGELLDPNDTPKNQEMEGNEMIDLRMK
ncbi:hypothetical protein ACLKA6_016538 [Drosophila palustris]